MDCPALFRRGLLAVLMLTGTALQAADLMDNADLYGGAPASRDAGLSATTLSGQVAQIVQQGSQNLADLGQVGQDQLASIIQQGSDQQAFILQQGENQLASILQIGQGNSADITQIGSDNQAAIAQLGSNNSASVEQIGSGLSSSVVSAAVGRASRSSNIDPPKGNGHVPPHRPRLYRSAGRHRGPG